MSCGMTACFISIYRNNRHWNQLFWCVYVYFTQQHQHSQGWMGSEEDPTAVVFMSVYDKCSKLCITKYQSHCCYDHVMLSLLLWSRDIVSVNMISLDLRTVLLGVRLNRWSDLGLEVEQQFLEGWTVAAGWIRVVDGVVARRCCQVRQLRLHVIPVDDDQLCFASFRFWELYPSQSFSALSITWNEFTTMLTFHVEHLFTILGIL